MTTIAEAAETRSRAEAAHFRLWAEAAEEVNWIWHRRYQMQQDSRAWLKLLLQAERRESIHREVLFREHGVKH